MLFIFSEVTMVRLAVVEKQLILHTIELRLDVRSARLLATQTSKDCTRPDLYMLKKSNVSRPSVYLFKKN